MAKKSLVKAPRKYFVYIIVCADKSLYTGITTDLKRRLSEHKSGTGGHYTRARKAVKIVYTEEHPNRSAASKREAQIKRLPREVKLSLIRSHKPRRAPALSVLR